MTNEDKDKKEYELAVLVKAEEDLAGIAAFVKQHGVEGMGNFTAKKIALAYPIAKQTDAIFAYAIFHAFGDDVKTLEQDLRTEKTVIRSMIVIREKPVEQSVRTGQKPSWQGVRPSTPAEVKPVSHPLSNEALEKKIEEILQ